MEFVLEISIDLISASIILLTIVSFSSVPILNISSPTVISLLRNLPYRDSMHPLTLRSS